MVRYYKILWRILWFPNFNIGTTAEGDTLLSDFGLSNEFPAVIQEPVEKKTYYFSGDFTHTNIPYWTSRFVGWKS